MASQHGALTFIAEGSTRRKEILAKFLDLELFEKKFKIAKEEAADTKGALRRFEGHDFNADLEEALKCLRANEAMTQEKREECTAHQFDIDAVKKEISLVDEKLKSMPSEIVNITEVQQKITDGAVMRDALYKENEEIRTVCEEKRLLYEKIVGFIETFDIESYRLKKKEVVDLNLELEKVASELKETSRTKELHQSKVKLLSEVPCGEEYSHCKFIKDAYISKLAIPKALQSMKAQQNSFIKLQDELSLYSTSKIEEHLDKYENVLKKRDKTANEIAQCELQTEKNQNQIILLENELSGFKEKKEVYEANKEVVENYSNLKKEKILLSKRNKKLENYMVDCKDLLQQLYVSHGGFTERVENIKSQQVELQSLRKEYEAYDLFMKAMHANGISYDIIKKRLPVINDEVAKVLANVVDFEVFFEESGTSRLDIYIKHPKHNPRPLEMGSGAEKSIAAMAIRLGLLNVSTLPKPNLFILDEPGTSLDEENMEGFVRIFDLVKHISIP
jgi:DNA repair exonuclease SbcCD ATPase subunit